MTNQPGPPARLAPDEAATIVEVDRLGRTIRMTNLASVIALAVGGLALLAAGAPAAPVGITCAGVYALVNIWLVAVEAPSGMRRSGELRYDDVRGLWVSIIYNSLILIALLTIACAVAYYAMRDGTGDARFWTTAGLILIVNAAGLFWYRRHISGLLSKLKAQLLRSGTVGES